jgi:hypothetical protein
MNVNLANAKTTSLTNNRYIYVIFFNEYSIYSVRN